MAVRGTFFGQLLRKYRSTINLLKTGIPYFLRSGSEKHIKLYHLERLIKHSYVEQYRKILQSQ